MIRTGGCHCGRVRYRAQLPDDSLAGVRCNCSICAMKGAVMTYLPKEALTVTSGEDSVATYRFNTGVARHHFCPTCGIHCFHQTRSNPDMWAVNVATIDGVRVYEDYAEVPVVDGQSHALDNNGKRRMAGVLRFVPSPD